jgi:hypothetical protein
VFQFSFSLNHTKRIEQVSKGVDTVQDFLLGLGEYSRINATNEFEMILFKLKNRSLVNFANFNNARYSIFGY